jgi:hypothetical protein
MERVTATADGSSPRGDARAANAAVARSAVYLNGRSTRSTLRRLRPDCRPVAADEVLPVGAHLLTPRPGYTHHGIYVGEGRVVHYAGLARSYVRGPVEEVPLEAFADGRSLFVKTSGAALYPAEAIVERARSRLGEDCYRIATNNCEHFCEWCLRGESRSEQVERWMALPRLVVRYLRCAAVSLPAAVRRSSGDSSGRSGRSAA